MNLIDHHLGGLAIAYACAVGIVESMYVAGWLLASNSPGHYSPYSLDASTCHEISLVLNIVMMPCCVMVYRKKTYIAKWRLARIAGGVHIIGIILSVVARVG